MSEWEKSEISLDIPDESNISTSKPVKEENARLLPGDNSTADRKMSYSSLFSFEFYQNLFDVDTDTVLSRIRTSCIPKQNFSFIEGVLRSRRRSGPDMYGPFWICVTLVFSTAICGNLSNFITLRGSSEYNYSPEFEKVSLAATTIFGYAWILPLIIYFFMSYKTSSDYQFLEIVCAYGYSLFVYVPISFFWIFPWEMFRWAMLIGGAVVSGNMLAQSLWPAMRSEKKQLVYMLLGFVLVSNLALAIGFKVYFFGAVAEPLETRTLEIRSDIVEPVANLAQNEVNDSVMAAFAPDANASHALPNEQNPINEVQAESVQGDSNVEQLLQSNSENVANEPVSNLVEDSDPAENATDDNQNSENQNTVLDNIPAEIPQNLAEIPNSETAAEIPEAGHQSIQEPVQQIEPKQQQFEAVQQQFDPVQAGPSEPAQVAQISPENVVLENAVVDPPAPVEPKKEEDDELSEFDKKELEALDAAFAKFNSGSSVEALPDTSKEGAMDAQAKMWEDYYKLHPEMRPVEEKSVETGVQSVVNPVADSSVVAQQPVQQYQQPEQQQYQQPVQQYQQPQQILQQYAQQPVPYQQPVQQYQQQDQQVIQQFQQPAQEQYQQPVQQYQQPPQVPQQYVQQQVQYQQPAQQYVQQPAVPQYIPQ